MKQFMDGSMVKTRDNASGQFVETVSDDEILAYIAEENGAGTTDVADYAGFKQPSAYRRLKHLEDEGRVTKRRIGSSLFWEVDDE